MNGQLTITYFNKMVKGHGTLEEKRAFRKLREEDLVLNALIENLEEAIIAKNREEQEQEFKKFLELYEATQKEELTGTEQESESVKILPLEIEGIENDKKWIPETARLRWLALAASVILCIGLSWIYVSQDKLDLAIAQHGLQTIPILRKSMGNIETNGVSDGCALSDDINETSFFRLSGKDFGQNLERFVALTTAETICKSYWEGWLSMKSLDYKSAINHFQAVVKNPVPSKQRQEASHGLIVAYLFEGKDEQALNVAEQLSKEPVLSAPAQEYAKLVITEGRK
ncbi:tetratricopeptide repeat protein [Dyadobacter diqingensis]|uniref:tetratricopeptide repeat protein n=1 Tax=Dyadobacter diqingensis TaxID=2938121 RepID=UPI0020C1AEBE|nr:hypothetical protein [Dyadobacter diqingensis]